MKLFDISNTPVLSTATTLTYTFTNSDKAKYSSFDFVSVNGVESITFTNGVNTVNIPSVSDIQLNDTLVSVTFVAPGWLDPAGLAAYTGKIIFYF